METKNLNFFYKCIKDNKIYISADPNKIREIKPAFGRVQLIYQVNKRNFAWIKDTENKYKQNLIGSEEAVLNYYKLCGVINNFIVLPIEK